MKSVINELREYHKRQAELLALYPNANMTVKSKEEHDRNTRLLAEIDAILAAQPAPLADAELAELVRLESEADKGTWWAENKDDGDDEDEAYTIFTTVGDERTEIASMAWWYSTGKQPNADFIVAMRNALPGLLARLAAAEAALKKATDRLPAIAQELGDAEDLADEGDGDGYEACYNAAGNARGAINGLLRELTPTVKGGQQDA